MTVICPSKLRTFKPALLDLWLGPGFFGAWGLAGRMNLAGRMRRKKRRPALFSDLCSFVYSASVGLGRRIASCFNSSAAQAGAERGERHPSKPANLGRLLASGPGWHSLLSAVIPVLAGGGGTSPALQGASAGGGVPVSSRGLAVFWYPSERFRGGRGVT